MVNYQKNAKAKFSSLKHNGPVFPKEENYRTEVKINGEMNQFNFESSLMLRAWARVCKRPYGKDKIFIKNFRDDLFVVLEREGFLDDSIVKDDFPNKWNFDPIFEDFEREKNIEKSMTPERKKQLKKESEEIKEKYGYAEVDGERYELGNFYIEPAGIFIGRGNHPLRGKWKSAIRPEDIVINCTGEPPEPPTGHKWGGVIDNRNAYQTAYWRVPTCSSLKRIVFSRSSPIVHKNDEMKFEIGRQLLKRWDEIVDFVNKKMDSENSYEKEAAIVARLIIALGIRVGDEKDEDSADIIGASCIRYEHVKFNDDIEFDFLGKDSIPFKRSLKCDTKELKNLYIKMLTRYAEIEEKIKNKESDIETRLFPTANTKAVCKLLNQIMPGLTARTFRTAHATNIMMEGLKTHNKDYDAIKTFQNANMNVAKFLNHQKTLDKESEKKRLENFNKRIKKLEERRKEIKLAIDESKRVIEEKTTKRKIPTEKDLNKIEEKLLLEKNKENYRQIICDVSPITSLTNYIDPRICFSFAKKNDVAPEKIYSKSLLKKHTWAIETKKNFIDEYLTK